MQSVQKVQFGSHKTSSSYLLSLPFWQPSNKISYGSPLLYTAQLCGVSRLWLYFPSEMWITQVPLELPLFSWTQQWDQCHPFFTFWYPNFRYFHKIYCLQMSHAITSHATLVHIKLALPESKPRKANTMTTPIHLPLNPHCGRPPGDWRYTSYHHLSCLKLSSHDARWALLHPADLSTSAQGWSQVRG